MRLKLETVVKISAFNDKGLRSDFIFKMHGRNYGWSRDLLPGVNQFINQKQYLKFKWRVYWTNGQMKMQFLSESHLNRIYKQSFFLLTHAYHTYQFLVSELTIDYSYLSRN